MSPEEELRAASVELEQAQARFVLELRNWRAFQDARNEFMDGMRRQGMNHDTAQEHFEDCMRGHSERFIAALESKHRSSADLLAIVRRFPHLDPIFFGTQA